MLDRGPRRRGVVVLGDPELGPEDLEHRHERHRRAWARPWAAEHLDPSGPAPLGELVAETALAHPRPRHHADDLAVALAARAKAASRAAISPRPGPTNREKPRAAATSSGVRSAPRPTSSKTVDRLAAPLGSLRPEVTQLEYPSTSAAVAAVT